MESQRIKIEIKGIQRDVSPMLAPMGSCQQMTNLRIRDGALRPVSPKLKMYDATPGTFVPPADVELPGEELSYTLEIIITGDGIVKVNNSAFEGVATFERDMSLFLEAIADPLWVWVEWSGDLTGNDPTESILLDQDKVITALFQLAELEIWNEENTAEQYEMDLLYSEVDIVILKSGLENWYLDSMTYYLYGSPATVLVEHHYSTDDGYSWDPVIQGTEYPNNALFRVTAQELDMDQVWGEIVFKTPAGATKTLTINPQS